VVLSISGSHLQPLSQHTISSGLHRAAAGWCPLASAARSVRPPRCRRPVGCWGQSGRCGAWR